MEKRCLPTCTVSEGTEMGTANARSSPATIGSGEPSGCEPSGFVIVTQLSYIASLTTKSRTSSFCVLSRPPEKRTRKPSNVNDSPRASGGKYMVSVAATPVSESKPLPLRTGSQAGPTISAIGASPVSQQVFVTMEAGGTPLFLQRLSVEQSSCHQGVAPTSVCSTIGHCPHA